MALVTCETCRGVGKVFGMGYIHRTCPKCEGDGEVSDVVVLAAVSDAPKTRAKRVSKEVNDTRTMAPMVALEPMVGV